MEIYNINNDYKWWIDNFGDDIRPNIASCLFSIFLDIRTIKPIPDIKDDDEFNSLIYNIALGFRVDDSNIIIPTPFGLKKRSYALGSLFLRRLDHYKGEERWDYFCEEIIILANALKYGVLKLSPSEFDQPIQLQNLPENIGIITKNYNFVLNDNTKGEIDIIIDNNHRLFLVEAKSLQKGGNKSYVKKRAPFQCDKYLKAIQEGHLSAILNDKGKSLDTYDQVCIVIVTNSYSGFHFVTSPDTGYVYPVASTHEFLRYYIGYISIKDPLKIDRLIQEFLSFYKPFLKNPSFVESSINQIKYMMNTLKRQILEILYYDWRSGPFPIRTPKLMFPETNNELEFFFNTKSYVWMEYYFPGEPHWMLKEPKVIHNGSFRIALMTQLGNTHIKRFCIKCNTVFVYYIGNNRLSISIKDFMCPFCNDNLIDIPSNLRNNSELYDPLFTFSKGLLDQRMNGDFIFPRNILRE